MSNGGRRILIIKLGALGDFFLAQPALQAICAHHQADHRTLLTIPALSRLARLSGFYDAVLEDPRGRSLASYWAIRRLLRQGRFDRVYDLQAQARTERYYWSLFPGPWPEWSGAARGASHPDRYPGRRRVAAAERYRRQLAPFGIAVPDSADLSWLDADVGRLLPPGPFVLLIPGSSPERPEKRWPLAAFVGLARLLAGRGLTALVIGGPAEAPLGAALAAEVPGTIDLTGRTGLAEIAGLARHARLVIGNDTGPTHIASATGAPSVALYSAASGLVQTIGPRVTVRFAERLDTLSVASVLAAADEALATAPPLAQG